MSSSHDLLCRLARLQEQERPFSLDRKAAETLWDDEQERERLIQDFNRQNPKLARQITRAAKTKDVGFLLKQLLRGAFWGAATVSNPVLIGGSLLVKQWIKRRKRQQALKKFLQAHGVESDIEDEE